MVSNYLLVSSLSSFVMWSNEKKYIASAWFPTCILSPHYHVFFAVSDKNQFVIDRCAIGQTISAAEMNDDERICGRFLQNQVSNCNVGQLA
jgi:hypothetical protein